MSRTPRVAIIGLDCAEPTLFERWRGELPVLDSLARRGVWGRLRSTIPPITTPAWMAMVSGYDPGQLGIYGFRNRRSYHYDDLALAFSTAIRVPLLWDRLGDAGFTNLVVGVPQTYPPRRIRGYMVTGFLTPGIDSEFTHPPALRDEILAVCPGYPFDVPDFRTDDKARLLRDTWSTTRDRFLVVRHLTKTKPWDFLMMVEIGVDRIHHGFWHLMDPEHILHEPHSPYCDAIRDYYRLIDHEVGTLLELMPPGVLVLMVSDHGAQRMDGGFAINEWLVSEGYLKLRRKPNPGTPIKECDVDWGNTVAWGYGGYYGRVLLNVRGREPEGVVDPRDYDKVRAEIGEKLEAFRLPDGSLLGNVVFRPEDAYQEVKGIAPDLIVYFGGLRWRSLGTVGSGEVLASTNDTGPDGANHGQDGMYIACRLGDREVCRNASSEDHSYLDIAPTVLEAFGLDTPAGMAGQALRL